LRADQLQGEEADAAAAEAIAHLTLANSYATPYLRPIILVVGGLSGTGKSTLAAALAETLGAELLRSDVVRKELYPVTESAAPNEGFYQPELRQRVYEELTRRAVHLQRSGMSVILDGTYSTATSVRSTHAMLPSSAGQSLFIECRCAPQIAHNRIAARLQTGADASDATLAVYDHQATNWEPWPSTVPQLQVDTEQPLEEQVAAVLARLTYST
ncbi:MAG TPA: AAA family ATPase, partial [Pirellulaceae bacterium]|nr:AAA family ATPase [Pirellulaceae bacterium]